MQLLFCLHKFYICCCNLPPQKCFTYAVVIYLHRNVLHMLLLICSPQSLHNYVVIILFSTSFTYAVVFFPTQISHMLLLFCSPQGNGRKLYYRARTVPTAGVPTSISVPLIEVNTVLPLYL